MLNFHPFEVQLDEEVPIGRLVVDVREELNYSPDRIFSLQDMFMFLSKLVWSNNYYGEENILIDIKMRTDRI